MKKMISTYMMDIDLRRRRMILEAVQDLEGLTAYGVNIVALAGMGDTEGVKLQLWLMVEDGLLWAEPDHTSLKTYYITELGEQYLEQAKTEGAGK